MKGLNGHREAHWSIGTVDVHPIGRWRTIKTKYALIQANNKKSKLPWISIEMSVSLNSESSSNTTFCHLASEFHRS